MKNDPQERDGEPHLSPHKSALGMQDFHEFCHDLAKFSNSQHKDRGLARAPRALNPYLYAKLAKSSSAMA